ncbi:MAG: lytic transglycosylase domain-containing protein [Sphingobacteriales bacterium]
MRKYCFILTFFTCSWIHTSANTIHDTIVLNTTPQAKELALLTLNPRAIPFVKDYLDVHQTRLINMKSTALPYFIMIEKILEEQGLPIQLKYLAVIESNLKPTAVSWAGAVGPWQFMPETGRSMGLLINNKIDERTDLYKSTYAASKYLKKLYPQLNDWLLVIAAYNGGSGRVTSAIKKSGSKDFWDLQYHLPAESRTHVKKFIATHYIMEGQGGETTRGAEEQEIQDANTIPEELSKGTISQNITGKYLATEMARIIEIDLPTFKKLNPQFDSKVSVENYMLRLPEAKMGIFNEKRFQILEASIMARLQQLPEMGTLYPKEISLPASTPKNEVKSPKKTAGKKK